MKTTPLPQDIEEAALRRFWAKVALPNESGCLLWAASTNHSGYGQFFHAGRMVRAHRFAYNALIGEIPAGLELDHLCRNRACVAPDHLEPVTSAVNTLRGNSGRPQAARTHCPQGHSYSGENLRTSPGGWRRCRTCQRAHDAAYKARKAATVTLGGVA